MAESRADAFGSFGGRVWLNCAHQGPLPLVSVEAAQEAIEQKRSPHLIPDEAFWEVPLRLKGAIGSLIGAPSEEITLANSTSYGLNLLAQGLPWRSGDEVLVVEGDFPATVVTWLPLRKQGVQIRTLRPQQVIPTASEVERAITPSTRLFCSSWVFSFFGHAIEVEAMSEVCRAHDVLFVLNGSQAIGTRPIDVAEANVDVLVSCGFKWLCGPYGTGFCWTRPEVIDSLTFEPAYWLTQISSGELDDKADYRLRGVRDAATYDVFGTANFLNFMPLRTSIELLLEVGIGDIARHNQQLVERFLSGLDGDRFELVSPSTGPERSTLILIAPRDRSSTESIYRTLGENGIDVALRGQKIRVSPHLYNTADDVDKALDILLNAN